MTPKERSDFNLIRDFYAEVKLHQSYDASLRSYMRELMQFDGNPMKKLRMDADYGNDDAETVLRTLNSRYTRFDPVIF